jgi:hypothetical protein
VIHTHTLEAQTNFLVVICTVSPPQVKKLYTCALVDKWSSTRDGDRIGNVLRSTTILT